MLCIVFAALPGAALADGASGGGAAFERPVVSAPQGAFAGAPSRVIGNVAPGTAEVSVEVRGSDGLWTVVGSAAVDAGGSFETVWTPAAAGLYDFRFVPRGAVRVAADGDPADGTLAVYRRQKATWYGPGFYGRRTACGLKLTRRTQGVAHRSLPCGSRVELFSGGRRVVVPVIDRGPFVRGVVWDLTYATARSLGRLETRVLGALPLG